MKKVASCILILISLHAIGQQKALYTSATFVNKMPARNAQKTVFTYKLIPAAGSTYGYDIFADGTLILHQQDMPGKAAGTGFASKEDATKVAQRVILKLEHPIAPPVVSTAEFQLLGIQ